MESPLQLTLISEAIEIEIRAGWEITAVATAIQPTLSVTVAVYVPAGTLSTTESVCDEGSSQR